MTRLFQAQWNIKEAIPHRGNKNQPWWHDAFWGTVIAAQPEFKVDVRGETKRPCKGKLGGRVGEGKGG